MTLALSGEAATAARAPLVLDADDYFAERKLAQSVRRDRQAVQVAANLSIADKALLESVGIVRVGEVDFGEWPKDDERYGTPRRLPLYLIKHDEHVALGYPNGFPGHNERVQCFCGHCRPFLSTRFRGLRELGALAGLAWRMRKRSA